MSAFIAKLRAPITKEDREFLFHRASHHLRRLAPSAQSPDEFTELFTIAKGLENLIGMPGLKADDQCAQVLDHVAKLFGTTSEKILAYNRHPEISAARHLAMWACCELGFSSLSVGRIFRRHHASILHGRNRVAHSPELGLKLKRDALQMWLQTEFSTSTA